MSDESEFNSHSFEDDLDKEFDADSEQDLDDLLDEDSLGIDDFWGEDTAQEMTQSYEDYPDQDAFADELGLEMNTDPIVDLFEESCSQADVRSDLRDMLERGMSRALAAPDSTEFFKQVVRSLNEAENSLYSTTATLKENRVSKQLKQSVSAKSQERPKKQNGHHPDLKREIELQPLTRGLKQLRLLIQQYAKRGLGEWAVLEDAIALLADMNSEATTPILAGLAARITLKPILEQYRQSLNPSIRKNLFRAASKATTLFSKHHALPALPGLAANVGRYAIQRDRPLSELPQDFYQAATRVATNPKLQQRLAHFTFEEPASFAIDQHQMPMTLRINGPIEIHVQLSQGQ